MGLFLLNKWDKADRDQEEMEKYQERINNIQIVRNDKELNGLKIDEARLRKLAKIKSQHSEHKVVVDRANETEKENLKQVCFLFMQFADDTLWREIIGSIRVYQMNFQI